MKKQIQALFVALLVFLLAACGPAQTGAPQSPALPAETVPAAAAQTAQPTPAPETSPAQTPEAPPEQMPEAAEPTPVPLPESGSYTG